MVDGFQYSKVDAAIRLLCAYKPWWLEFTKKVTVVPIEEPVFEGEKYSATMKLLPDLGMLVDSNFVRSSTVEDIAGKYDYEINKFIRNYWKRFGHVHEDERETMRSACMGMEIASAIEADDKRLQYVSPYHVPGLSGDFIKKWNIKSAPTLPEFLWRAEDYGFKTGMLAEDYYLEMTKYSNQKQQGSGEQGEEEQEDNQSSSSDSEPQSQLEDDYDTLSDMLGSDSDDTNDDQKDDVSGESQDSSNSNSGENESEQSEVTDNEFHQESEQGESGEESAESQANQDSQSQDVDSEQQSHGNNDDGADPENKDGGVSEKHQEEMESSSSNVDDSEDSETDSSSEQSLDSKDAQNSTEKVGFGEQNPENHESAQSDSKDSGTNSEVSGSGNEDMASEGLSSPSNDTKELQRSDFIEPEDDETHETVAERVKNETESSAVKSWEAETPEPEEYHEEYEPMDNDDIDSMLGSMMDSISDSNNGMTAIKPGMNLMTLQRKYEEMNNDKILKRMGRELSSIANRATTQGSDDFTYAKRNPNQQPIGPIFMGTQSYSPKAVLIMDVSASMMAFFAANYKKMSETCKDYLLKYCDEIYWATVDHKIIFQGTSKDMVRNPMDKYNHGFGVTDIAPVIQDIDKGRYEHNGRRLGKVDLIILASDCIFDWSLLGDKKIKTPMLTVSPYSIEEMKSLKTPYANAPDWVLNERRYFHLYSK